MGVPRLAPQLMRTQIGFRMVPQGFEMSSTQAVCASQMRKLSLQCMLCKLPTHYCRATLDCRRG